MCQAASTHSFAAERTGVLVMIAPRRHIAFKTMPWRPVARSPTSVCAPRPAGREVIAVDLEHVESAQLGARVRPMAADQVEHR